eukprot:m.87186 g.87186  ORF g.87186 m.87186 type:complete len:541 (+) comp11532_c0_seq1:156-1778(+)
MKMSILNLLPFFLGVVTCQVIIQNPTAEQFSLANTLGAVSPSFDTTSITGINALGGNNGRKWVAFVYCPSTGKFYAAPERAHSVLVVDPVARSASQFSVPSIPGNVNYYFSMAYAENVNRIFAAPNGADAIMIINPVTNSASYLGSGLGSYSPGDNGFGFIAYAPPTGLLYCTPATNTSSVLVINPNNNQLSRIPITPGPGWGYLVYVPRTVKMYAVNQDLLVIDPLTHSVEILQLNINPLHNSQGMTFAPNVGKLIGFATNSTHSELFIFDPVTNSSDIFPMPMNARNNHGLLYVPLVGKLYSAPSHGTVNWIEIDPITNQTRTVAGRVGSLGFPAYDPVTQSVFAPPSGGDVVPIVSFHINGTILFNNISRQSASVAASEARLQNVTDELSDCQACTPGTALQGGTCRVVVGPAQSNNDNSSNDAAMPVLPVVGIAIACVVVSVIVTAVAMRRCQPIPDDVVAGPNDAHMNIEGIVFDAEIVDDADNLNDELPSGNAFVDDNYETLDNVMPTRAASSIARGATTLDADNYMAPPTLPQ